MDKHDVHLNKIYDNEFSRVTSHDLKLVNKHAN